MIFTAFLLKYSSKLGKFKYGVFLIPLIVIVFSFSFSDTIFKKDQLEIITINKRRGYYQNQFLAKIFENKVNRYFFNYQKNLFEGADLNYYFFGTHPRERPGVKEIEKLSFVFLPFFLLGLYLQIKTRTFLSIFYFLFSLFLASFFRPIDIYSFLFFPFIVLSINSGIYGFLSKNFLKKNGEK